MHPSRRRRCAGDRRCADRSLPHVAERKTGTEVPVSYLCLQGSSPIDLLPTVPTIASGVPMGGGRDGQHTLRLRGVCWRLKGHVAEERMDCRQPQVRVLAVIPRLASRSSRKATTRGASMSSSISAEGALHSLCCTNLSSSWNVSRYEAIVCAPGDPTRNWTPRDLAPDTRHS
jgi:hypothetical protein